MKTNKYLDKVFKIMDERDKEKKKKVVQQHKNRMYCKKFKKGSNGFCKYYMGCTVDIVSCASECAAGGVRYESRKDTGNTTTRCT